jgi:transposase
VDPRQGARVAAPRPPRFDAAAEEVALTAAADWEALAAVARPCVACPELAATRQHVVVGDVPTGGRPQFVNTSALHDYRPAPAATGNGLLELVSCGWSVTCPVLSDHGERLGQELVPDGLWELVEPLIPPQTERPQGGGTRYVDDRAVFTAVVYVLTTGCARRHLPAEFGVSKATAHRRFVAWTEAGLWRRLHRAVLDRLGEQAAIDWSRAVVDAASVRAKKGVR